MRLTLIINLLMFVSITIRPLRVSHGRAMRCQGLRGVGAAIEDHGRSLTNPSCVNCRRAYTATLVVYTIGITLRSS